MKGQFLGVMPPDTFLARFMPLGEGVAPAPEANFSGVSRESLNDMRITFVKAVEKYKVCPGLRLFAARMKKRSTAPEPEKNSSAGSSVQGEDECDPVPPLAARRQPKVRRGTRKRKDIREYYDFATSLLNIELFPDPAADPFIDPIDYAHLSGVLEGTSEDTAMDDTVFTGPSSPQTPSSSVSRRLVRPEAHLRREDISQQFLVDSFGMRRRPAAGDGGSPRPYPISQGTRQRNELPPDDLDPPSPSADSTNRPFARQTDEAYDARVALATRAKALFSKQHRLFFLQIVLVDNAARFLFWDRSGFVVSERFSYHRRPDLLASFLWRFAHLNDEQRGMDPTVSRPSKKEDAVFAQAVRAFLDEMNVGAKDGQIVRRLPDAERTLDNSDPYPTWKVHLVNEATGSSTDVIIKRPFTDHFVIFGRATRGYLAYDLQKQCLIFLKDSWRPVDPKLRAEFQTYCELESQGVSHLPNILYGGDVRYESGDVQATVVQDLVAEDWQTAEYDIDKHIHHRIAQDIAYPIDDVLDDRELLQAFHDVLTAVGEAYDRCGILNRDISVRNIMITAEGRGILNDWDHAGRKDANVCGIGTWRFMSIRVLGSRDKVHDIADDLESVFWALVWCALKYFAPPGQVFPDDIFDYAIADSAGRIFGGSTKAACIAEDRLTLLQFTSVPLARVVRDMSCHWFYFDLVYHRKPICETMELSGLNTKAMYDNAVSPAFWAGQVAEGLADVEKLGTTPNSSLPNHAAARSEGGSPARGTKRKAGNREEDSAESQQLPRRSKRLRASHRGPSHASQQPKYTR